MDSVVAMPVAASGDFASDAAALLRLLAARERRG